MATLQVDIWRLVECGFTQPQQANSFFPQGDPDTHVHLGVPTQHLGQVAPPGRVFVTYVSIKQNGATLANLSKSGVTGRFNPNFGGVWPPGFEDAVNCLGILQ